MSKSNYPVNIINAKKIDKRNIRIINEGVTVKKYQNMINTNYGYYKPISKLFNLK